MSRHKGLRKAEEVNFMANFSFFTSLLAAETRIWNEIYYNWALWNCYFYCNSGLFLLRRKRLWSDVWPVMYGVVCLSILLRGGVTVSNNFTKRRQNGSKIGTRDKFATHLR